MSGFPKLTIKVNRCLPSMSDGSEGVESATHPALLQILRSIHMELVKRDPRNFFADPVTDAIAPFYSKIIKSPMDLGTMLFKLNSGRAYYRSLDYCRDALLMCANAMIYNTPDTIYHQKAKKLAQFCYKTFHPDQMCKYSDQMNLSINLQPPWIYFGSLADFQHLLHLHESRLRDENAFKPIRQVASRRYSRESASQSSSMATTATTSAGAAAFHQTSRPSYPMESDEFEEDFDDEEEEEDDVDTIDSRRHHHRSSSSSVVGGFRGGIVRRSRRGRGHHHHHHHRSTGGSHSRKRTTTTRKRRFTARLGSGDEESVDDGANEDDDEWCEPEEKSSGVDEEDDEVEEDEEDVVDDLVDDGVEEILSDAEEDTRLCNMEDEEDVLRVVNGQQQQPPHLGTVVSLLNDKRDHDFVLSSNNKSPAAGSSLSKNSEDTEGGVCCIDQDDSTAPASNNKKKAMISIFCGETDGVASIAPHVNISENAKLAEQLVPPIRTVIRLSQQQQSLSQSQLLPQHQPLPQLQQQQPTPRSKATKRWAGSEVDLDDFDDDFLVGITAAAASGGSAAAAGGGSYGIGSESLHHFNTPPVKAKKVRVAVESLELTQKQMDEIQKAAKIARERLNRRGRPRVCYIQGDPETKQVVGVFCSKAEGRLSPKQIDYEDQAEVEDEDDTFFFSSTTNSHAERKPILLDSDVAAVLLEPKLPALPVADAVDSEVKATIEKLNFQPKEILTSNIQEDRLAQLNDHQLRHLLSVYENPLCVEFVWSQLEFTSHCQENSTVRQLVKDRLNMVTKNRHERTSIWQDIIS